MFSLPFPSLLLFLGAAVVGLTRGQSSFLPWPTISRPSDLNDFFWIKGSGDNPYTWACKGGTKLMYGRWYDSEWKLYSWNTVDDAECLSKLVMGNAEALSYGNGLNSILLMAIMNLARIPIEKLHSRKLVQSKELDRFNINTIHATVRNLHNRIQEGSTPSYSQSTTDTHEVSIEISASVSASAKIGIPLVGETEIQVTVGGSHTTTSSRSETKTIEAPSQKITLDPRTEATIAFRFYKVQKRNDYLLDFTIDEKDTAFNKLKDQIKNGDVTVQLNRGESGPDLRLENDKWIVSGFPATESFWGYGTDVVIGEARPVPDNDILTWALPAPDDHIIYL